MGWLGRRYAVACMMLGATLGGLAQDMERGSHWPEGAVLVGQAEASRRMEGMSLRYAMTPAQQSALRALLIEQQTPGSPEYQHWLTPEEFGERFGIGAAERAVVVTWLQNQGFRVSTVGRGGLFVQFSGTVGRVDAAFQVAIQEVTVEGKRHIANLNVPVLSKEISGVVAGVTGFDDFGVSAMSRSVAVDGEKSPVAGPRYTSGGAHPLAPGDLYTIYDESALLAGGTNGAGITVAVMGQTDISLADIATFRAAGGLPPSVPTIALYGTDPGTGSAADVTLAESEVEWVGAMAPGATILYVNSSNVINGSLTSAVDNNVASILVDGYGQCEAGIGAAGIVFYEQLLQQAAAEGITIVAASGNHGATDCDVTGASATQGMAVDFPASSPYVTAVGGTEFNENGGTYFGVMNGTNGGSALSYVPEVVWNDDGASGLAASGGGASLYFSKPGWQVGTGVLADFSRDVPDVSLSASVIHDGYLVCLPGDCTNGFQSATGAVDVAGGTPLSAAVFGGMMALVEQHVAASTTIQSGRVGVANSTLYSLGASVYGASVFHDVVAGTNASPCTAGTVGCSGAAIGYRAGAGYDQATGLGSVDVFSFVNDWLKVTPLGIGQGTAPTFTNVAASASPVKAGTSVTLTATVEQAMVAGVTPVTANPTGNVQFTVDSAAVGGAVGISAAGGATYLLATTGLSVGTHTIQATYTGDANFAGSKGAFVLTVTSATPADFTLTPATSTVMVASGGVSQGLVLTVAAVNGFQGNVQFTASSTPVLGAQTSFSLNPVVLSSTVASGQTTFVVLAYTPIAKSVRGAGLAGISGVGGVVFAGLLLGLWPLRRRRMGGALVLILLGFGALGVSGCAGGGVAAPAATTTPTAAGTYNVTITAAGTMNGVTTSHTAAVTFVVQ
jgi:subtilase family serine protease